MTELLNKVKEAGELIYRISTLFVKEDFDYTLSRCEDEYKTYKEKSIHQTEYFKSVVDDLQLAIQKYKDLVSLLENHK